MTFADVVTALSDGVAAKRETWGGYVRRTDVGTEGAYKLTFVKRNNTTCEYNVSSTGVITCASPISFDVDLLAAMMANDWIYGDADNFAAALSGTGVW